ncbi:predicted protein [Nematostella vectensis]|uniref:Cytochrome b561 domain-containing protein n=1 Tax=Nematostella vectensis TaxID=45351 RepID=A7T5F6_NEMVE|nr:predicted protein [Nematostella vectensis]|eukprot:XP_001620905.1 hypothetical protein NEMVEDRAFT_v1g248743 [Nematostella vectensis]
MLIAWVGFATVGMATARYMRTFWGDSKIMSLLVWFQIHRSCMVIVVLSTIISTILVFVYVGGWSEIGAHAYIGIAVLVLAVLQPMIAVFRPHPGDENRIEVYMWKDKSKPPPPHPDDDQGMQVEEEERSNGREIVRKVLYVCWILLAFVCCVVLLVLIGRKNRFQFSEEPV